MYAEAVKQLDPPENERSGAAWLSGPFAVYPFAGKRADRFCLRESAGICRDLHGLAKSGDAYYNQHRNKGTGDGRQ